MLSWKKRFSNFVRKLYYKYWVGVELGLNGTIPACFGPGKYVSVKKRGPYVEIVGHKRFNNIPTGTIRLIPCQYNHGVMVEYISPDGKVKCRTNCNYDKFYEIATSGVENNYK